MTSSFVPIFAAAKVEDVKVKSTTINVSISVEYLLNDIVTPDQKQKLLTLKFKEQPLFNLNQREVLFELIGYLEESKVSDSKVSDSKVSDSKVSDSKVSDSKVSDSKVSDSKVSDSKVSDSKVSDSKLQSAVDFLLSNPFTKCKDWRDIIFELPNLKRSKERVALDLEMITYQARGVKGSGKCGKCGNTEIIYTIKQTRAGDEAATTYAECGSRACGNKWRVS
jgi:DNA-directed RNA polymerase subunit M/transcription elongation factor TFIIS